MNEALSFKKTYDRPIYLDDDPWWVRYKKAIIAGSITFVLFLILLIVIAGVETEHHHDGGGDTPKPDEPVVDPFVLTPQSFNEENSEFEFAHNFNGTDSWVEDIAANHDYYFVAEGCANETKRMSIYDPTSEKLVKAIEMSNDTSPKRYDS